MDAINAVVLPALALIILAGCSVMAWLIFRPPPITKAREERRESPRARAKKRVL